MRTAPSTDAALPRAWPLDNVPDELLGWAAQTWRLAGDDPRGEIERRMGDGAWLRARLGELPEPELAALGALADAGGAMAHDELCELLELRWGIDESRATRAVDALHRRAFTVPLTDIGWQGRRIDALVAPAASGVAAAVRGLDLAEPPAQWREPPPTPAQRRVVAIAAALTHEAVRITNAGTPHRAHVKRLAKRLGVEPDEAESWIGGAWCAGLVREDAGDELRPNHDNLERTAAGAIVGPAYAARCADAWLGPRPVPLAGLARAASAEMAAHQRGVPADWSAVALARETRVLKFLAGLPGLAIAEHGGCVFVARRSPARGHGDGHVTPSFEVMLGPDADLLALAHVGLVAELSRIDRVLTYRITRASVTAAVETGLSADAIVAALGRVGPHGVPQNVEQTVRDWCAGAAIARVCTGRFVFVEPGRAGAARAALGDEVLAEPAPGALQVSPRLTEARLRKLLAAAGVHRLSRAPGAVDQVQRPRDHGDDVDGDPEPSATPPLPLCATGDAVLRERFAAWCAGAAELPHPDGDAAPAPAPLAGDFTGIDFDEVELLAAALVETESALRAWAGRLSPLEAESLAAARRSGLVTGLMALTARARGRVLAQCRSVPELMDALVRARDRDFDGDIYWAIDGLAAEAGVDPDDPADLEHVVRVACARSRSGAETGAFEPLPGVSAADAVAIAAREAEPVGVHITGGETYVVLVEGVVARGRARIVLAHDLDDDVPRAWPIDDVAEVRFSVDSRAMRAARGSSRAPRPRWAPAPGEPVPAPSDPCPCGSGRRYKKCCKRR